MMFSSPLGHPRWTGFFPRAVLLGAALLAWAPHVSGDTLVVLDNSGSMSGALSGGGSRADEARRALTDSFIPALPKGEKAALWAFGGGCRGFQFQGDFGSGRGAVGVDLTRLSSPSGSTPLARSVASALNKLAKRPHPRHLIVVTDGYDTCGGDPCAEVRQATSGGAKVSVHTVGLGMSKSSGDFRVLQCMADASPEGSAHAVDRRAGPQVFQEILGDIAGQLDEPKGRLTVELRDAGGALRQGVAYTVQDAKGSELRGRSGESFALPAGTYTLEGLADQKQTVVIQPGRDARLEVKSSLGRLIARIACPADGSFLPTTSFALLDASGKTVRTGEIGDGQSFDLPPGSYRLALTQFVPLPPSEVRITAASQVVVEIPVLGSLEVSARDAAGQAIHVPLEVFDNGSVPDSRPIATGQTNEPFLLPAGVYNVRISADDPRVNQFQGGTNVRVQPCTQSRSELKQRSVLLVCNPAGTFSAWNDATGQEFNGSAGTELALAPGRYNLRLSNGQWLGNLRVDAGVTRVGCD